MRFVALFPPFEATATIGVLLFVFNVAKKLKETIGQQLIKVKFTQNQYNICLKLTSCRNS